MRFEKLDLNLLVALEALLQEQNVTAAADRVCLSQSAMSGVLNRLRDYFGDELLVKVGRQMALTPRAQTLVEPVRNALLIIKNTIATAPEFIPAEAQRKFTLSTSDYFLDINLSGVMRRLGKEAPGVSIDVVLPDENTQTKFERVDIDLVVALEQYMSNDHPYEVLFEEDHVVVAWKDNPHCVDGVSEKAFSELGHVAVRFGQRRAPAFVEQYLQAQRVKRRIEATVPFFGGIPQLILGTNRIATMMRRQAHMYAKMLPLAIHELPIEIPTVRECAQWHNFRRSEPATLWLVQRLKDESASPSTYG